MAGAPQRQPRFLWTGLMILGPVLALGAVGLWQLRQDRATALSEARVEAEGQLEKLLPRLKFDHLGGKGSSLILEIDSLELVNPIPFPEIPIPNATPSPQAEAMDALLEDENLDLAEKANALADLAKKGGFTPSGISVKKLALHNAIRIGKEAGVERWHLEAWATFLYMDAIRDHPSAMSQRLMDEAAEYYGPASKPGSMANFRRSFDQRGNWISDQNARRGYRENAAGIHKMANAFKNGSARNSDGGVTGWIGSAPVVYCSVEDMSVEVETSYVKQRWGKPMDALWVLLFPFDDMAQRAEDLVPEELLLSPNRGVRISLDRRTIYEEGLTTKSEVLAAGANSDTKVGIEIFVTDPAQLFEPVKKRSQRTAFLIALAVLAAGIGWFAAYRAFVRQQQLSAMKDNFVSAVSHELKAPIASIGLMAEELREGSDKREEYTRLIAGECSRLGSLVDNVLDYARIESGTEAFAFEEADIGELVRAAAELMRPSAAERGIEIDVEAPPVGELCAIVDARAIGRALVNLLDNAVKYAPSKSEVTIKAEDSTITVADTGHPIPAGEREQIFERFVRSGSELTRETKGVGIGLSLVRHIAEAHGGKAWVDATAEGNRFSIKFGTPISKA